MHGESPNAPVDLLVVGAGPAGTAAAFRAVELGLSVFVVDRDCVLSILKNWVEEEKLVDAEYDDCSGLPFPAGGDLIEQLRFQDQMPAGDLYRRWMGIYDGRPIPYRNGVEFVRSEVLPGGLVRAELQEVQTQKTFQIHCRTLLLALGLGTSTKMRLPGDTTGIRYRLGAAKNFVGAPACVVGGGMSAAEAVVAIAIAKTEANDPSDVFWCYRGRSMDKVTKGKALAPRFYEAWTKGNIRYLPHSEPLAIFRDERGKEFVAIKTRRVIQQNAPSELICHEFEKSQVLALIGSERPIDFLGTLGIGQFGAADAPAKKRLGVRPLLETQVPGVFLAGSLLDPAYIETTDFRPEALQNTVKEHPGCFKNAIRDGVGVAEAVHKRLAGGSDEVIRDQLVEQALKNTHVLPPSRPLPNPKPVEQATARLVEAEMVFGAMMVHTNMMDPAAPRKADLFLPLGDSVVGRSVGKVVVGEDALLLDSHAMIRVDAEECYVSNAAQGGDCFIRLNSERTIQPGSILVAGSQRIRLDVVGGRLSLSVLDAQGRVVRTLGVTKEERALGRDTLDAKDSTLSRAHMLVSDAGGVALVRDNSRNGTFLELHGRMRLNEDDEIWMGNQVLRFVEMRTGEATAPPVPVPAAPAAPAVAPGRTKVEAPAAPVGDPVVLLPGGQKVPVAPDKSILDVLVEAGCATDDAGGLSSSCQVLWECNKGNCGKCIVTVAQGMELLSVMNTKEKSSIAKINKKLGGKCDEARSRLCCMTRLAGGTVSLVPNGNTDV